MVDNVREIIKARAEQHLEGRLDAGHDFTEDSVMDDVNTALEENLRKEMKRS